MVRFECYELPPEAKAKMAGLRHEMAAKRFLLASYRLLDLLRKSNFNPNQPRVPSGSSDGGRWTGGGGGGAVGPERPWPGRTNPRAEFRLVNVA
jgi:hypothetical protein